MSFSSLLNRSVTIRKRSGETQDGMGSVTPTFTEVVNVKTTFGNVKTPALINGNYQTTIEDLVFYFEKDIDIESDDEIEDEDGVIYTVMVIHKDSRGHHIQAYARYGRIT